LPDSSVLSPTLSFRVIAIHMLVRDRYLDRLTLTSYFPSLIGVTAICFPISKQCFNSSAGQRVLREPLDTIAGEHASRLELCRNHGWNRQGTLIGVPTRVTGPEKSLQKMKRQNCGRHLERISLTLVAFVRQGRWVSRTTKD
jgi:hypothetical protein